MLTLTARWAKGVFYGWWVLASSVALQFLTASFTLGSFGTYIAVMQEDLGWSTTAFSVAFAVQQAGGGFLGPGIGWLLVRFGPRLVIRIGLVTFSLALVLMGRVETLPAFYGVVALVALGASLSGYLPLNTLVVQWFDRRRSTALALVQTGISLGGFVVPVVAWSLATYGWRGTVTVTGILTALIGLPLTGLLGNRPEDYGLVPDGKPDPGRTTGTPTTRYDFSAGEAVRTRAFWFISFGHGLALSVVFAVLAHVVVFLREESFSLSLAALMVTVITSLSIVGQLIGGVLGDRLDKRLLATSAMFGHATALVMLVWGGTLPWVVAFAVIHGLSWGLRGPIMQSLRADYFGRRHFGAIMGLSSPIITVGMIGGPLLVGALADRYGSYGLGFTVLAVLAALGSAFFILATPPEGRS